MESVNSYHRQSYVIFKATYTGSATSKTRIHPLDTSHPTNVVQKRSLWHTLFWSIDNISLECEQISVGTTKRYQTFHQEIELLNAARKRINECPLWC